MPDAPKRSPSDKLAYENRLQWAEVMLGLVTLGTITALIAVILASVTTSAMSFQRQQTPLLDEVYTGIFDSKVFPDDLILKQEKEKQAFGARVKEGLDRACSTRIRIAYLDPRDDRASQHIQHFVDLCTAHFANVSLTLEAPLTSEDYGSHNRRLQELVVAALEDHQQASSSPNTNEDVLLFVDEALEGPVSFLGFLTCFSSELYDSVRWQSMSSYSMAEAFRLGIMGASGLPVGFRSNGSIMLSDVTPLDKHNLAHSLGYQQLIPSAGKEKPFKAKSFFGGVCLYHAEALRDVVPHELFTSSPTTVTNKGYYAPYLTLNTALRKTDQDFAVLINNQFGVLYKTYSIDA